MEYAGGVSRFALRRNQSAGVSIRHCDIHQQAVHGVALSVRDAAAHADVHLRQARQLGVLALDDAGAVHDARCAAPRVQPGHACVGVQRSLLGPHLRVAPPLHLGFLGLLGAPPSAHNPILPHQALFCVMSPMHVWRVLVSRHAALHSM